MFSVRVEFEDKMLRGIRLFAKGISHEHPQPGMQKPTPLFPLIPGKPTRMTCHFSMNSRDPKPNLPNILGSGRPPAPQQWGSTFDAENSPVFGSNWCHDFRCIRWWFFLKRVKPPLKGVRLVLWSTQLHQNQESGYPKVAGIRTTRRLMDQIYRYKKK